MQQPPVGPPSIPSAVALQNHVVPAPPPNPTQLPSTQTQPPGGELRQPVSMSSYSMAPLSGTNGCKHDVFVGNIPYTIDENYLISMFGQQGLVKIMGVRLMKDSDQRRYGFIEYETVEDAIAAIRKFRHADPVEGRKLRVDYSKSLKDTAMQYGYRVDTVDNRNVDDAVNNLSIDEVYYLMEYFVDRAMSRPGELTSFLQKKPELAEAIVKMQLRIGMIDRAPPPLVMNLNQNINNDSNVNSTTTTTTNPPPPPPPQSIQGMPPPPPFQQSFTAHGGPGGGVEGQNPPPPPPPPFSYPGSSINMAIEIPPPVGGQIPYQIPPTTGSIPAPYGNGNVPPPSIQPSSSSSNVPYNPNSNSDFNAVVEQLNSMTDGERQQLDALTIPQIQGIEDPFARQQLLDLKNYYISTKIMNSNS